MSHRAVALGARLAVASRRRRVRRECNTSAAGRSAIAMIFLYFMDIHLSSQTDSVTGARRIRRDANFVSIYKNERGESGKIN